MGNFDIRTGNVPDSEKELEKALRPLSFSDFQGQKKIVDNLEISGSRSVARPSRIGKDNFVGYYC